MGRLAGGRFLKGPRWSCSRRCRWPSGATPRRRCTVSPDRRQDPARRERPAQPLVERPVPPHRPRHHDPPHGQVDGNPIFTIDFDFVDHQLSSPQPGRHSDLVPAARPVGGVLPPTAPCRRWPPSGVRVDIDRTPSPSTCRTPTGRSPRTPSTPPTTRRRPPATGRSSARSSLVLEEFAAGLLGQGQPGTPLLAHLRHRPHPVLRAPDRPAAAGRPGDPGGVLPGGDQLRLLVRRRHLRGAGLLLLHRARARRAGRGTTQARGRAVDRQRGQPPGRAALRRRPRRGRPRAAVLDFYESAYQAGAGRAAWDIARLACPGGITDPLLATPR